MNNNPSRRIDELARRVLQSAQWPIPPSIISDGSPTPYLDELERSLEIHLPPLSSLSNNDVGSSNGIRTCTVPNGMAKQSSDSSSTANNTEIFLIHLNKVSDCRQR